MWIAFRLAVALLAFVARYVRLAWPPAAGGMHAGEPWYRTLKATGRGSDQRIDGFRVGIAMHAPVVFRLQQEGPTDRLLKGLGLAHEFQTGDTQFDREVYIACDNPALHRALKDRAEARDAVVDALSAGFDRISSDGRVLWFERKSNVEPSTDDVDRLVRLRRAIGVLHTRFLSDPYDARIVAVEALTWSIFAYAVSALVEYAYSPDETYLDASSLVTPGLLVGAGIFLGTAVLVVLLLRNSSRGARIFLEAAVLLILGAPLAGIQLLADANRVLDRSPPVATTWQVTGWRVDRPRRAPPVYYLSLEAKDSSGMRTGNDIAVPRPIYERVRRGSRIDILVGRGAFGYPWIRRMEVGAR